MEEKGGVERKKVQDIDSDTEMERQAKRKIAGQTAR